MQQQKLLRISSGTAKNKKLEVPKIPNFRPVQEIAKQAVFAILAGKIKDARCLDLFAGSGNMGIEALSRGASWCDFVDNNYDAGQVIEKNLFNCGFTDSAEIFTKSAIKFCEEALPSNKKFSLIFIDPFYNDTAQVHLLKLLPRLLKSNGMAVLFYGKQLVLEEVLKDSKLKVTTTRRFGATIFSILHIAN